MRLAMSRDSLVAGQLGREIAEQDEPAESDSPFFERAFSSYGVPFRIRTPSAALLAELPAILPHRTEALERRVEGSVEVFSLLPGDAMEGFCYYRGSELVLEDLNLHPVLEQLKTDLMVHVANLAPQYVFVHAGVVAWRGRALLLPGASFAGKTTLTAALVRAGATYYSDEYAVVDAGGRVHPYARPLQVREPGGSAQRSVAVETLAGVAGIEPLPVAQVVFAQFRGGAHWKPTPLSPGLAVLEMLRHTIPVQRTPARVMATLTALMTGASAWSGERGEADATAAALLRVLEEPVGVRPV